MQFLKETHKIKINFFGFIFKTALFIYIFLTISLYSPAITNAGFFSFFTNSLNNETSTKTVYEIDNTNSQNMTILQATINSDPNPNKYLNDNPLVLGNALMAEIGPSGTISDIEQTVVNTQISLYIVREGDTLSNIAEMFNVSVNTITWANDLSRSSVLKEGQKLLILPISGVKYTIKKGDTIKGIVNKFKSDLSEVLQYNDLTLASTLNVGDIIVIPDAEPVFDQIPKIASAKKSKVNGLHDADGPYYPGYYTRPIDGGYISQGLHGYNAIDIAVSAGTPIHAAADGIVIASITGSWNGGYGGLVIISHSNGTQTLYAHTLKNFVRVGDRVKQDQMIAKVGSTGNSTGPHLHFEIRGAKNPF